jgi:ABC-type lipoprotein export system ATPase subunit
MKLLSRPGASVNGDAPRETSQRQGDATDVPAVDLRAIGRTFGSDPPVTALRDVNLTLHKGAAVAIVGPSGSGKTSLLNLLGCLDRQTTGTYLLDGIDVGGLSDEQRAGLRAQRIGFVFQTFNLLGHRTVLENVTLADVYRGAPSEGRAERALQSLERVGMTKRATFLPTRLSGGEQQRVAIARALMGNRSLLLCDEPTGNLDSVNTDSVLSLFDELDRDLTMVLITHDSHVAEHLPRRVRIIDGQLSEEEP